MNVDLLKLVFSLCIIGVHLDLFKEINLLAYRTLTQSLFRIGVPFYFITSGYFFAGKLEDKARRNAWLFRLIRIYIIFELLDIVLTMLVPGISYPFGYVVLRIFTTGMNRIYWYLISLILTCAICSELWRKGYTVHLIAAGFFLYLITMTYDSYSFLFENTFMAKIGEAHRYVWAWPQAGFGESVLFLSTGVFLRQNQPRLRHMDLLLCISMICLIIEGNLCQSHGAADANCYFFLIPSSVLLFLSALKHDSLLQLKYAAAMSLYIYMTHMYWSFVSAAFSQNSMIRFIFTAVLSSATSFLIVLFQRRKAKT